MALFQVLQVACLGLETVPLDIIAIVVIAQDRVLTERRLQCTETFDIRIDLPGHVVHQVARKNEKITVLRAGQIDAALHSPLVIKAAGVDIRYLSDRKTVESFRKVPEMQLSLCSRKSYLPFNIA